MNKQRRSSYFGAALWRRAVLLRSTVIVGAAGLVQHLGAGLALAQDPGRAVDDEEAGLRWGITAGVAVVILVAAFIQSKRSHLG